MRISMLMAIMISVLMVTGAAALLAQSPVIFYSDLVDGPNTGGQNNKGAFVTIYGKGFGSTRGTSTVTIGGGQADNYPVWTDTKISMQLGGSAASGNIVVNVSGNGASNGIPFTIRAGNIYFVSTTGNDSAAGSYTAPWRTITHANQSLTPGAIAYIENGVTQTALDNYDASLSIQTTGNAGAPMALIAYPGAAVTIGSAATGSPSFGARTPNIDRTSNHWVVAGIHFTGGQEGLDLTDSDDWRIVGNDFTCPDKGYTPAACVVVSQGTHVEFLGNNVHDVAVNAPGQSTKQYHGVYFTTDSNHDEVAWNVIANVQACRGLQFHSSPLDSGTGHNQYDLHVHDNVIHDTVCDGINFATIDPSKGPVEAYNNVIYRAGLGPDPKDGEANYACIYIQGGSEAGPAGSGQAEVYNNTMYDCGARKNSDSGALSFSSGSPSQTVRLRNNIINLLSGESYFTQNSPTSGINGTNNLCDGVGGCPSVMNTAGLTVDPQFVNLSGHDFHLKSSSPAVDAGVTISGLKTDIDGIARPQGSAFDIGASEFYTGSRSSKPSSPTNLVATPH